MSSEAFVLIAAAHPCLAAGLGWGQVGRGQGEARSRECGPHSFAVVSVGQERQGFPGRQLQAKPRSHLRGTHLMAPNGSRVLPAVGTTQLHWVDRWPSDQDSRVGRPEEQTGAQPWVPR